MTSLTTRAEAGIADKRKEERLAQLISMRVTETDDPRLAKRVDDGRNSGTRNGRARRRLLFGRSLLLAGQQEEGADNY